MHLSILEANLIVLSSLDHALRLCLMGSFSICQNLAKFVYVEFKI